MTYCIWQKPFAKTVSKANFLDQQRIFIPFTHSSDVDAPIQHYIASQRYDLLREYYLRKGYRYTTSAKNIKKYINLCKNLKEMDEILIPHRSFDKKADKQKAYLCRIIKPYQFEKVHDIYALFYEIEVLDPNVPLPRVIRKSIEKI